MAAPEPLVIDAGDLAIGAGNRAARARRRVTWELGVVVAALTALTALRWIDTTSPSALPLLQAIVPLAVPFAAAPAALYAAATRRWRTAIVAAALVALHLTSLVPWWTPGPHATDAAAGLTVMTSNLHHGQADADALLTAVRTHEVDVLALTEVTPAALAEVRTVGLTDALPHLAGRARTDTGGLALLSRHPLADAAVPGPTMYSEAPAVRVRAPSGDVVVLGVHVVPPLAALATMWRRELAAVGRWADGQAGAPLVVAGDFNATDAHPGLRELTDSGLAQAHNERGTGLSATWPAGGRFAGLPPLFPIDHVFVRDLGVSAAGVVDIPGTDHRAAWATVVVSSR